MTSSILIVENDPENRAFHLDHCIRAGLCASVVAQTLDAGVKEASATDFKLIVLDRNTRGNGAEAMARIRAKGCRAMLLVLTALDGSPHRIEGWSRADDYLAKPMSPDELRRRMQALLRRNALQVKESRRIVCGNIEIRLDLRSVNVAGKPVDISPREFELISYLARHEGEVVSRAQLLENVWRLKFDPGTNVIDVHVGRLRRKLDQAGVQAIHTARGAGYIFAPSLRLRSVI